MEKKMYVKPALIALDEVAPVCGASCPGGNNPALIEWCPSGNIATSDCKSNGGTAGHACYQTGQTPKWGSLSVRRNPGLN